jgi:hypothetical protein
MGGSNINLDGSETTVIKGIGLMGSEVDGATLFKNCKGMDGRDFLDTLKGLMDVGFVDSDAYSFHSVEEIEDYRFRINPGYMKEIREALDPSPEPSKSKRVRRD